MNTIKIFLAPSGATASIYKDFPLYQGSFQNKLLNVYVPTSILSPDFKTYNANSGAEEDPFVAGTAVKVAMETIARNGKFAYSKDYYVRYLKTLIKDGVEYALFERKLPQEFTFYAGQGVNAPALILNVVNMAFAVESAKIKNYELPGGSCSITAFSEEEFISKIGKPTASRSYIFENVHQTAYASGHYYYESTLEGKTVSPIDYGITLQGALPASTPGYIDVGVTVTGEILSVTTSQRVKLDVLPSSNLDKEESVEPSEWEEVEARLNALTAALAAKQDKEDNTLTTPKKTVVGAINWLDGRVKSNSQSITTESLRIDKAQQDIIALQKRPAGTHYIGKMKVAEVQPTEDQIDAFVRSVEGADYVIQNGDSVIVEVTKKKATDEVYFYKWNDIEWTYYALPPVEPASNDNLGLVQGDTSFKHGNVSVTIVNGIITSIKVLSNGQPIEVSNYLDDLDTLLQKIVTGEQTVGKAERALKDGLGQTISDTYLDKTVGASKNYVQDYALPKKFNENLYLQKSGSDFIYAPTIVDEEVTTVDTGTAFGYTTIYTADYALVDTKFNLNAKNSINIVNTLSLDVATQTAFIARAYVIGADGTETLLAAKQSSFETIPANTAKEIAFSMAFVELGKREITVASGDKIRIQFVVFKTAPTAANISLVSGGTSSSINLFVDSQTIAVIDGIQGKLAGEYRANNYISSGNDILFNFPAADLIDGCVYRLTATKPSVTATKIQFSFGSQPNWKIYNVTTPTWSNDLQGLAACGQFENATGTEYAFLGLVQGDTIILLGDNLAGVIETADEAKAIALKAQSTADEVKTELGGKVDKASIVQTKGDAEDKVMSQKTVTDDLNTKLDKVTDITAYQAAYVTKRDGSQSTVEISYPSKADTIPIRNTDGSISGIQNELTSYSDLQINRLYTLGGLWLKTLKLIDGKSYDSQTMLTTNGRLSLCFLRDTTVPYNVIFQPKSGTVAYTEDITTKFLDYLLKSGGIISGNLSIQGDLEVRGTTKTTEEETLNVKDSIVVTNSSGADLSSTLAGFVIRLNTTDCYGIIYDASSESVKLGKGKITDGKFTFNSGEGNAVAVRADGTLMTNGHLVKWDATALKFVDAGKSVEDFVEKITDVTDSNRVYGADANGNQRVFTTSQRVPAASNIVQLTNDGTSRTNDPINPLDAVNKQYFEAKTAVLIDNSLLGG